MTTGPDADICARCDYSRGSHADQRLYKICPEFVAPTGLCAHPVVIEFRDGVWWCGPDGCGAVQLVRPGAQRPVDGHWHRLLKRYEPRQLSDVEAINLHNRLLHVEEALVGIVPGWKVPR